MACGRKEQHHTGRIGWLRAIPFAAGTSLLFLALLGAWAAHVGGARVLSGAAACCLLGRVSDGSDFRGGSAVWDRSVSGLRTPSTLEA